MRIKLNRKGVRELLRSAEVSTDLAERADRVAADAGPGFDSVWETGKNRARAAVHTDGTEIIRDPHVVLLAALDAARH